MAKRVPRTMSAPKENKLLTMQEVMQLTRIKSRATFYKMIVPIEKKRANPDRYGHCIGYKNINPEGAYEKRLFPKTEVDKYLEIRTTAAE